MSNIGERIREARKRLGLTMQNLHEISGLSTGNISDMENNKYMPSVSSLIPLSKALNCSIDWLITGTYNTYDTQLSECNMVKESPSSYGNKIICDGIPLSESESDLIAMFRLIDSVDQKTIFDLTKLKYEQLTGEKVSIYSTYSDTKERQKIDQEKGSSSSEGIA